ncbi:MAG: M48 family metallopeptidase [Gammaproteobacteria bacterium]|nr:M48 family metallopeptidase [Gammaproteobacteria bacterium]MBU1725755.1 M48 family metallopeptidase [Gammaproteobacteria bacterium]MBU2006939.1 M48 family metallopeptidase [Gammaproteobacteria bacterium]
MHNTHLKLPDGRSVNFTIRPNPRAKYMRMHLSADKGLVVTQPAGVNAHQLLQWINSQMDWIATHLPKVEALAQQSPAQTLCVPDSVELPATGETLKIIYTSTADRGITRSYRANDSLLLTGAVGNTEFCCQVLQDWLKDYARYHLGKLLQQATQETGLHYDSYRVKGQTTRWGSCSTRGNINLNYKLMLLPAEWVRYTLIHELCHTVEMNHSRRFWALVEKFVPEYKTVHADMKGAMARLPGWVNAE